MVPAHRSLLLLLLAAPALAFSACAPKPDDTADTDDTDLAIVDTAPALTLDAPRDGQAYAPGEAVLVGGFTVDDVDAASALTVLVTSSVDGEVGRLVVASDGTFSDSVALGGGGHLLTIAVTDSAGNTASASVSVVVDDPAVDDAPSAPVVRIDPELPVTGDTLSLVVVTPAVDPEGAVVTYRYAWTADGADLGGAASVSGVTRGQAVTLTVTPNDGTQDGTPAVATVTVGNAPPTAEAIRISPEAPTVDDTLTCAVDGLADLEGDALSVTYEWMVSGGRDSDGAETLPAGNFGPGEEIYCSALVSDGFDTSVFTSDILTIATRAPSAPTVAITPDPAADTDDLVCVVTVDAVDPDGGVITYTYAWDVDGAAAGVTSDTVAAADTTRDEVWTCTVTAGNTGGGSVTGAASITVGRAWEGDVSASDAWVTVDGAVSSGAFGKTLALLGDTDGDGLSELVVGANGENSTDGAVYLFAGADLTGPLTTADATASWTGAWTDGQLGGYRSLGAVGDLDEDGAAEILFGAAEADANGLSSGQAYLAYGGVSVGLGADPRDSDWLVTATAGDQVGARMAAGDLDGDGHVDILVAAPGSSTGSRGAGLVGLFYGDGSRWTGSTAVQAADWYVTGDADGDGLGWTTKFVGDVTGDGYVDLVVGAMYADPTGSESGLLGLVAGGAGRLAGADALSDVAAARFSGDAAGDRFGYDAQGDVDLDADGVGDLLIAAYQDDTGAADAGAVYAWLGGGSWSATLEPADADVAILGASSAARFGHVMASPGDLDGDGTGDLLLGALFDSSAGLTYQGAASVLLAPDYARVATDADIPWRASGEAASDLFGDALSAGRGDLDGDGKMDFAVGAQGYDGGASGAGRVYVWRGR